MPHHSSEVANQPGHSVLSVDLNSYFFFADGRWKVFSFVRQTGKTPPKARSDWIVLSEFLWWLKGHLVRKPVLMLMPNEQSDEGMPCLLLKSTETILCQNEQCMFWPGKTAYYAQHYMTIYIKVKLRPACTAWQCVQFFQSYRVYMVKSEGR